MLEDILDGQTFKCYYCKKRKNHTKFWQLPDDSSIKLGSRPVYKFCMDCDKVRIRKIKYKVPCRICNEYYKLYENNTCRKCTKASGLKRCYKCKDIMLMYYDFYCINSRYCKRCDNVSRSNTYKKKLLKSNKVSKVLIKRK